MGRFFLTSRGSLGDVYPFIGLGCELRKRGHEVTLILNEVHRPSVEKTGLGFVPYAPVSAHLEEQEANRHLGKPDAPQHALSYEARLRRWHLPELRATYAALAEQADPRDSVVVARGLTFAGRLAQERLGIPLATVYLSPPESIRLWLGVPLLLNRPPPTRWLYDLLCVPKIDRHHDPQYSFINEFRAELGLAPVKHIQSRWLESPQLALGLWPDWFYPRLGHWSRHMRTPGFVLHETRVDEPLSAELDAFLSAGAPPVVFAPGTFRSSGAEAFFSTSLDICQRLGRRGLFLSESRAQVPASLPESIATFASVPLRKVLQRCAALVHHGGIGTTARALEAGLPQFVVSVFGDQPVNAMRLSQLGVAGTVHERDYRADAVTPMLQRLLTDTRVREACATQARRMAGQDATALACDALEELLASRSRAEPARLRRAAT
ncbi:glycosyltransferase [Pyxidicoccus caerfyrddinensis]|uniref:glycosyltransferase n=1 Tax=Pyxidicoccus caerfyrddinensis TaxID=2709663 RepID=UPI0013D8F1F4|nr:nucleotide disphospho-sugar-binding domain-containing protein [Pyxidicoccus caerfyrddinensis]